MTRLNRDAADVVRRLPAGVVSACTDVTGFGLAGHGAGMAAASGCTLTFEMASVPLLEGALALAPGNAPGGTKTNETHFGPRVETATDVPDVLRRLAFDPQTSGGLLLAVESGATGHLLGRLADAGVEACVVGQVDPPDARGIRVRLA
jgi:selenide,water dikinase